MQAAADQGNDGGMEEDGNIMLLLDAAKELHESGDHPQDGEPIPESLLDSPRLQIMQPNEAASHNS